MPSALTVATCWAGCLAVAVLAGAESRRVVPMPEPSPSGLETGLESGDAAERARVCWQMADHLAPTSPSGGRLVHGLALYDPNDEVRRACTWVISLENACARERLPFGRQELPRVLRMPLPEYPAKAPAEDPDNPLFVRFTIDKYGKADRVELINSVAGLNVPAVEAVRQWRFEPARRNGKPFPLMIETRVVFAHPKAPAQP